MRENLSVRHAAWPAAVLLFAITLSCYLANGRTYPYMHAGDTIPNRLIPFSLLRFGTLTLDPFRGDIAAAGGYRWYLQERKGRLLSLYPVGTPLLALPVYVPVYAGLAITGDESSARLFAASELTEKVAASVLTALTVVIFYFLVRRRLPPAAAFWAAVAFGLGTSLWATASQLLWQHGAVVLTLTTALWLLTWPERPAWSLAGAGFLLGFTVLTRPSAAVFWLAGLACVFLEDGAAGGSLFRRIRRTIPFVAASAPPLAFAAAYNWLYYGSLLGGYGVITRQFSLARLGEGAGGLLLSPNRGLLVFTPIALLGILGLVRAFGRRARDPLLIAFGLAAFCHLLVVGSYREWAGGWSFGPRYLVDILPILGLAGATILPRVRSAALPLVWATLVWSILVQVNGAFIYPASRWNVRMSGQLEQAAWNWRSFSLWEDFEAWRRLGPAAPRF